MPAEWEPHERTVMCWPARAELYGARLADARTAHASVARALVDHEPVTMIAHPDHVDDAATACGSRVDVVGLPIDDSWFRDTGPIYVVDDAAVPRRRIATDWVFNGWGGKYDPIDADVDVARRWAEHAGDEVRAVPIVLEGGSITVDGAGTLLTTTQCLLHPNRNPRLTRADIERTLTAELGVTVIHWLPFGLADDDDTDGHVDNVAAFAAPGRVLVQGCDDDDEPDHVRLALGRRWIEGAADAAGRELDVVEIPVLPFAEVDGVRVPVPYLNLYVANGCVLVPVCGHPADDDMCAIVADQFPGRDVVALDVGAVLASGGGGIHCITQQVPRLAPTDATPPTLSA